MFRSTFSLYNTPISPCIRFFSSVTQKKHHKFKYIKYAAKGFGVIAIGAGLTGSIYYASRDNAAKRKIRVSVEGLGRFCRSLYVGVALSIDYWWATKNLEEDTDEYKNALIEAHQRSADRIVEGCLKNGGLYIKLGQGLVSMNHILPKEYLDTLKVLQDRCLSRRADEIDTIFKEEYGSSVEDIFEEFDREAIAAASLAQVFKARTKQGKEVAVKVQYIDLQDRFFGDMATVKILLEWIQFVHPKFSFKWVIDELQETLEQELDFVNEGHNSERCAKELAKIEGIYVPKVDWSLTNKRVLTTEFIHGHKISDISAMRDDGIFLKTIDSILVNAFSEQIFHTGFVHADPHPGNILVRKSNKGKPEVVLLDHGLYQYLPEETRLPLCGLWKDIILNDHNGMQINSKALGVEGRDTRLLCMAISQRYVPPNHEHSNEVFDIFYDDKGPKPMSFFHSLSEQEKQDIRRKVKAIHDRMLEMFRRIPTDLFLVLRNINTVRSIIETHGNLINRFTLMARSATRGAFVQRNTSTFCRFMGVIEQVKFDMHLKMLAWKMWWTRQLFLFIQFVQGTSFPNNVNM